VCTTCDCSMRSKPIFDSMVAASDSCFGMWHSLFDAPAHSHLTAWVFGVLFHLLQTVRARAFLGVSAGF